METREIYKQKFEAQLKELKAKLDEQKAHAQKLSAEAKLEMKPALDATHAKLEAAKEKLRAAAGATDDKWDSVKTDLDQAWQDAKASAEGAYDALTKHQKKPS
jgi:predicted ribosome quality control (RQC) complex YloA/Tae2 family protein